MVASVGIMIYLQAVAVLHFGTGQKSDLGWGPFTRSQEPVRNFLGLGWNLPRAAERHLLVTDGSNALR